MSPVDLEFDLDPDPEPVPEPEFFCPLFPFLVTKVLFNVDVDCISDFF